MTRLSSAVTRLERMARKGPVAGSCNCEAAMNKHRGAEPPSTALSAEDEAKLDRLLEKWRVRAEWRNAMTSEERRADAAARLKVARKALAHWSQPAGVLGYCEQCLELDGRRRMARLSVKFIAHAFEAPDHN